MRKRPSQTGKAVFGRTTQTYRVKTAMNGKKFQLTVKIGEMITPPLTLSHGGNRTF
jgi:hypothetical protein